MIGGLWITNMVNYISTVIKLLVSIETAYKERGINNKKQHENRQQQKE